MYRPDIFPIGYASNPDAAPAADMQAPPGFDADMQATIRLPPFGVGTDPLYEDHAAVGANANVYRPYLFAIYPPTPQQTEWDAHHRPRWDMAQAGMLAREQRERSKRHEAPLNLTSGYYDGGILD